MNLAPILIRGGGDLATGVALRLRRVGLRVVIVELPEPLAVRRMASFSEAVFEGEIRIEDRVARRVELRQLRNVLRRGDVPVVVDPEARLILEDEYSVVVDARMRKEPPAPLPKRVPLLIGLGPGFLPGQNCDATVETRRGPFMGRVYWTGAAEPDSGQPDGDPRRVLRAPAAGVLEECLPIASHVSEGSLLARAIMDAADERMDPPIEIRSPLKGVLRGMLRSGTRVQPGLKIGDVDPRDDPRLCFLASDKSLAVGGGVLEAILAELGKRNLPRDRD